jgi:hypothetical protein
MPLSSGSRLGPYEIVTPIGAGGMGEVYRARDVRLHREVAVKVLPGSFADDPDRLRRFEHEARAASALNHPGILTIHDFGEHEGAPYVVSELLEGQNLSERMEGSALPVRRALDYAVQIAHGLAAAHEKGIVHRDLKPANLFVTKDGRIKILDFGLAKLTQPEKHEGALSEIGTLTAQTEPGVVMGTVGYMSPEQIRGQPADHRSDIFSFGAVLYEMLAGRRAFLGGSAADTMSAILREDPPELVVADPALSLALDRVVRRCLEKDPQHRFHTVHDLAFALESLGGVSEALPRTAVPAAAPAPQARWLGPAIASGAAVLLVLAVLALWLAGFRFVRSRADGSAAAARATFQALTTQSGVELFPSISPDGKTFVYVGYSSGNADLYLQRIDGRNAINLTRDTPEADIQPAFSPDGSQIAFRSERGGGGIFLMGATGESVRRLTDAGFNPAWSHDGKEIVVRGRGHPDPALPQREEPSLGGRRGDGRKANRYAGGRRPAEVVGRRRPAELVASWAPHRLLGSPSRSPPRHLDGPSGSRCRRQTGRGRGPGHRRSGRRLEPGLVAGRRVPLLLERPQWDDEPVAGRNRREDRQGPGKAPARDGAVALGWSHEHRGGRAADGLCVGGRDVDRRERGLRSGRRTRGGGARAAARRRFARARDRHLSRREVDLVQLAGDARGSLVASSDGSSLRQFTSDAFRERGADWSADGRRIVFYSDRTGRWEFWSVNPDGSALTQLTRGTVDPWSARWSPDGARLAFPDGYNTYLLPLGLPLGTEKPEPLPRFDAAGDAFTVSSWSPDGRALAGTLTRPDGAEMPGIVIYQIDSKTYRRVTDFGDDAKWLSDSRRLLVGDSDTGRIRLVDSASGKSAPVLDQLRFRPGERSGSGIGITRAKFGISRDDKTLFLVRDHTEADIWLIELEGPPSSSR